MPKKINLQNLKLGYTDGTKVSEEDTKAFLIKLNEMSQKYEGTTPEDFLTLFIKENGLKDGVLLLDQKSKATTDSKGGRARGLIQFVPSTAKGLGLDQEQISKMTPVEQLEFVDKYYEPYKDSIKDYESLYLSTFYPVALGQSDDFVIGEGEQKAYTSNKGIDINKDKKITVSDFKKYAANTKPAQPKKLFNEVSDEEYAQSYIDLTSPPKPKYVIGEDENGKYVETLVDKGQPKIEFDPNKRGSSSQPGERYIKQYVKGAEILSTRTIGDNEYIVKAYTDDEGVLQNEYLSFTEKGADKNKLKKENKYELYKREISNIMQGGLTEENVEKAKDVYDTAIEDYRRSGDDELPDKDQKSYRVGNHFYKLAAAPFLEQEIKNVKQKQQEKLLDLQNKHASAFGEEKQKIGEQIKILEKDYADIVKQDKEISQSIKKITEGTPPTFMQGTPVIMGDFGQRSSRAERDQFDWYQDLFKDQVKKYRESEAYKSYYLDQQKQAELDKKSAARTGTTTTTTTTTTAAPDVDAGAPVDPDDIDFKQEEIDVTGKDYIDKTYLEEQLAEVNKQLDNVQKAEEFTPDLSMLDNRDRYGNLIAMASDLGVGYMGLKGAMEEIPEYEKGEMFKAYTDEAYRQRNMGYTPEEIGLRKQLAERGFGYDVKNIRRLTGGSAGVALGNLGRAAGTLQNRYAQIAAEDSAIRRLNQQRFDRAASADETLNRRKFEDDFKVAMMNKEMGAQLVRDKMTDMRERQQFEQQYGKGSVYDAMSREMLKSQQYNVHALKMAEQYQKDKQQDFLKQRQADIQSKLNQANQ
jgi:hypothetical protein